MFEPTPFPVSGSQQLLVGLLALQMEFISRSALIGAVRAWVHDKRQSLSHILVNEGALPGQQLGLLEGLAAEHLKAHEDSLYHSLASLPVLMSVQDEIRALGDADLNSSLVPPQRDDSEWPTKLWGPALAAEAATPDCRQPG